MKSVNIKYCKKPRHYCQNWDEICRTFVGIYISCKQPKKNELMTIKDLLTIYWSQFTLILIAIGSLVFYFIKRHFDKSSKKIEINHSLFQQNRLNLNNS